MSESRQTPGAEFPPFLARSTAVPAAQIQADWAQTNPAALDFIKSKPATVTWSTLTGKPTTISGYGITDAYPLTGNPSGFLTGITGGQVTTALGFTPYNATNPSGYITLSQVRLPLVATTIVGETGLTLLALSVRRVNVAVAGVVTTGRYVVIPTAAPPAGFSLQECFCATNGTLTIGVLVPIITGSYSIPIEVRQVG